MYFRKFAIAFLLCLFQATALHAAATLREVRDELIRVTGGYIALFPDETLVRLQEMADKNNSTAMGILGVIYINGLETGTSARKKTIVDPDPEKGAALCKRGAENDPTGYSQLCYAAALLDGKCVEQDYGKAEEIYRRLKTSHDINLKSNVLTRIDRIIADIAKVRNDANEKNIQALRGSSLSLTPLNTMYYSAYNNKISDLLEKANNESIADRYLARNELQKIINKGLSRERLPEIEKLDTSEKDLLKAYLLFSERKSETDADEAFALLSRMEDEAYENWRDNLFERFEEIGNRYILSNSRDNMEKLIRAEKSVDELRIWKDSAEKNSLNALLRGIVYVIRLNELDYTNHSSPLLLPCDILKNNRDAVISAFYTPDNLSPLHDRPIFDCPTEKMIQIPEYFKLTRDVRTWDMPSLLSLSANEEFSRIPVGLMASFKLPLVSMIAEAAPGKLLGIFKDAPEIMIPRYYGTGERQKAAVDVVQKSVEALSEYYQNQGFNTNAAIMLATQIVHASTPSHPEGSHGYNISGYVGINSKEIAEALKPRPVQTSVKTTEEETPFRLERVLYFMKEQPDLAEKLLREDIAKRKANADDVEKTGYQNWTQKKSEVYLALLLAVARPYSEDLNREISELIGAEYAGDPEVFVDVLATKISNVVIPCKLAEEHKELIASTATRYGGGGDQFLPSLDCSITDVAPTFEAYLKILDDSAGGYYECQAGSIRHVHAKAQRNLFSNALVNPEGTLVRKDSFYKSGYDVPLEKWGLHSLQNFRRYTEQVAPLYEKVKNELVGVFKRIRNISDDKADEYTQVFLSMAGNRSYWNDQYKNYKDTKRYKILHRRPIEEIKNAADDLATQNIYFLEQVGVEEPLLQIAVSYPEALVFLITEDGKKYSVNEVSEGTGKTALMNAAQYNQHDSVKILLRHGADPNIQLNHPLKIKGNGHTKCYAYNISYGKRTALMYAASFASLEIVKTLLEAGADKTIPDSQGLRAIHYLLGEGPLSRNTAMSQEDFIEAVKLLL